MRSSSRPLPNRPSTFFTIGGGPLLFPDGSICTCGRPVDMCMPLEMRSDWRKAVASHNGEPDS